MINNKIITFVSFADDLWADGLKRIEMQAKNCKIFDNVLCINESSLYKDTDFLINNKDVPKIFLPAFGGGCWKPYVIKKALELYPESDYIVYSDAGNEININENTKSRFLDYLEIAEKTGIMIMQGTHSEKIYTHCSVINSIYPEAANTDTYMSSLIIIKNEKFYLDIIDEWQNEMEKNNHKNIILQNIKCCEEFQVHLYDQSVISCILKKYKIKGLLNESDWYFGSPVQKNTVLENIDTFPFFVARNLFFKSVLGKCVSYRHLSICMHEDKNKCDKMIIVRS